MSDINEILKNTKFEHLIVKFEATGHKDIRSFVNIKLIEYLKNYVSEENDIFELSGIITTAINKSNKKISKVIWPTLIILWIFLGSIAVYFFFGFSKSKPDGPIVLAKAKTVEQAKERIDWIIADCLKDYNDYCSLPKNSTTEAKFNSLRITLLELTLAEKKCEKLDFNDQEKVGKYIMEQLGQKRELFELEENDRIICWN